MNKYIIEGNLDFKTAMASDIENEFINHEETCLVSQQLLTKSHIKLPCGHKFNYMPLYNELYKQKQKIQQKNIHSFETCHLKINQIKCPYCRTVFDNILPYIQSECIEKVHGVNYPFKFCMKNVVECDWVQRNKIKCCKEAQFIDDKSYCKLHFIKSKTDTIKSKTDTIKAHTIKAHDIKSQMDTIVWTTEMDKLYKSKKLHELKTVLKLHKQKVGGTKRELIERLFDKNLNSVFN
jgi:hypothetical protein